MLASIARPVVAGAENLKSPLYDEDEDEYSWEALDEDYSFYDIQINPQTGEVVILDQQYSELDDLKGSVITLQLKLKRPPTVVLKAAPKH